jgi:hypothetical protein
MAKKQEENRAGIMFFGETPAELIDGKAHVKLFIDEVSEEHLVDTIIVDPDGLYMNGPGIVDKAFQEWVKSRKYCDISNIQALWMLCRYAEESAAGIHAKQKTFRFMLSHVRPVPERTWPFVLTDDKGDLVEAPATV